METSPVLHMAQAGTVSGAVPVPQGYDLTQNFAKNTSDSTSGPFALILSQLRLESPPGLPGAPPEWSVPRQLTTQLTAPALPLAGNPLPVLNESRGSTDPDDATLLPPALLPAQPLPEDDVPQLQPRLLQVIDETAPAKRPLIATGPTRRLPLPTAELPVAEPRVDHVVLTRTADKPVSEALMSRAAQQPVVPALAADVAEEIRPASMPGVSNTIVTPALATPANAMPAGPTTQAPVSPQPSYSLQQPVADPQFGAELGQRLLWMNDKGIGRAELRLNPPELGPVEVRIAVTNDDARVAFHVQHGATRDALEQALPRLREMFASQGLNLSDANVSEQSADGRPQAGQSGDQHSNNSQPLGRLLPDDSDGADSRVSSATIEGMIDAYA